jgi:hypothetical protein
VARGGPPPPAGGARGPDAARIEWRPSVTRAAGDRSDAEATGGTAEAVIEIGRLDIEPVEIR